MSVPLSILKNIAPLKPNIQNAIKEIPECQKLLGEGYKLEAIHEYTNKDGKIIFYRVRLKNPNTNKKWVRPVHLKATKWVWGEPEFSDDLKPLYKLQDITLHPKAKIWVCEGEWAADHLNKFFHKQNVYGENIATTSGSCTSTSKADWNPLASRKIVIWPDYDEPGFKYAKDVADKLSTLNCDVEMVDVEALNLPKAGDAVDWLSVNQNAGLTEFESIKKIQPNFEEPIEPLFDTSEASVVDFLVAPPPPRIYLLEECLPMGKVGLLVGRLQLLRESPYVDIGLSVSVEIHLAYMRKKIPRNCIAVCITRLRDSTTKTRS